MKRITKGEDLTINVSELKSLKIKEAVGNSYLCLWKLKGDTVCLVRNVKVSEQMSSDVLPEGYFIEKRFSTIKTLDGNWVLVPGFDTYGFTDCSYKGILEDYINEFNKGNSLWVDEKNRVLYVEDRIVLERGHHQIDLSPLVQRNSHMPVFLVDNNLLTIGYWHNGYFYEATGTEMKGTKVHPLVHSVLAG